MKTIFSIKFFLLLIVVTFMFSCLVINVSSLEKSQNATIDEEKAFLCLNESRVTMSSMTADGFFVVRVNDSLKQIISLYDAQRVLKEKKDKYDFSLVFPYCDEIKNVSRNAYESRDSYAALKKFYNESVNEQMNTSSIDVIISQIDKEMNVERYEKLKPLIEQAYQEIVSVKTSTTTLSLFYKTTTRSLKDFLTENWITILIIIILLIVFYFIYKKTITKFLIKSKISGLEIRKNTLKDLIMRTQKDYFEKGSMSEGTYSIRTKKFAELIRDIDRQIPLLREELLKVDKNDKSLLGEDKTSEKTPEVQKISSEKPLNFTKKIKSRRKHK